MAKQKVDRIKFNPQLGRMPVLQILPPTELEVDHTYQRAADGSDSQTLIKRIAQHWNWDLCQPLVISRRRNPEGGGDRYFVIDGQHRLEAARLRGDVGQLPCVVLEFPTVADEAASFVHLNQLRKPLTKLQLFRAAVAGGDRQACAIVAAMADHGLSMATQTNYAFWKPGVMSNAAGIERAWEKHGEAVTRCALRVMAEAFRGQILQYAGTIFPGVVALCADEMVTGTAMPDERFERLTALVGKRSQAAWRSEISREKGLHPEMRFGAAAAYTLRLHWARVIGEPMAGECKAQPVDVAPQPATPPSAPPAKPAWAMPEPAPLPLTSDWCEQCDMRVSATQLAGCKSRWCSLKKLG